MANAAPVALPADGIVLLDRLKSRWADPSTRPALAGAGIGALMMVALFWENLRQFVFVWTNDANYSHGFLVPLMSLYFANEAAKSPARAVTRGSGLLIGPILLVICVLGRLAIEFVPVGLIADLAFIAGVAGLVATLSGRQGLWRYGFAIGFLVFMVPLPIHLYTKLASPLQLIVSQVAAAILNAGGLPVLREGNHMTLPGGIQMFVAEACSGMRQMTGFLALTTSVAYLVRQPWWYKAALVLSALPIALAANVARVTLTGWIMAYRPDYAQGTFHTVEGLLMMGFGLGLLWLECQALSMITESTECETSGRAIESTGVA